MLTKRIDGNTYTQCDRCKRFNIPTTDLATAVLVFGTTKPKGVSYLLCPECEKKFKKIMEDFINDEGSSV